MLLLEWGRTSPSAADDDREEEAREERTRKVVDLGQNFHNTVYDQN